MNTMEQNLANFDPGMSMKVPGIVDIFRAVDGNQQVCSGAEGRH